MAVGRDLNARLLRQWQGLHDWAAGALLVAPAANAVLVDTGPLSAGAYLFHVFGWSDTAMTYTVQHRTASNTGNAVSAATGVAKTQTFPITANSKDEFVFGNKESMEDQDRMRVILATGSGTPSNCQFGILYQEVADTQATDG